MICVAAFIFVSLCFIDLTNASCDIIVHVKSKTDTKFKAQVIASNDKKSDKFVFNKFKIFIFI